MVQCYESWHLVKIRRWFRLLHRGEDRECVKSLIGGHVRGLPSAEVSSDMEGTAYWGTYLLCTVLYEIGSRFILLRIQHTEQHTEIDNMENLSKTKNRTAHDANALCNSSVAFDSFLESSAAFYRAGGTGPSDTEK